MCHACVLIYNAPAPLATYSANHPMDVLDVCDDRSKFVLIMRDNPGSIFTLGSPWCDQCENLSSTAKIAPDALRAEFTHQYSLQHPIVDCSYIFTVISFE